MIALIRFLSLLLCAYCLSAAQHRRPVKTVSDEPQGLVRDVTCQQRDIVRVNVQRGFAAIIELPKDETIIRGITGDTGFWIVEGNQTETGAHNWQSVKPAMAGKATSLTVMTAANNMYFFLLRSTSGPGDLKVFVKPAIDNSPKMVLASEVEKYRGVAEKAQAMADEANRKADEAEKERIAADLEHERAMAKWKTDYPTSLKFPYRFRDKNPFAVRAIWNDGHFTFIDCRAAEPPAVYEMKDGKPNLITYAFSGHTYIVPKVMDDGFLRVGKKTLKFYAKD